MLFVAYATLRYHPLRFPEESLAETGFCSFVSSPQSVQKYVQTVNSA